MNPTGVRVSSVSRRRFLQLGAFSSAMLVLGRVRRGAIAAETAGPDELRVLTTRQAAIFTAIAARMTEAGDASMPRFADTAALFTVDRSLLFLDDDQRSQLGIALQLFEYGPLLFGLRLARFTTLTPNEQDAALAGWRDSRFATRRLAYRAMKNLSYLGYYSQDATWAGIHYLGPVLPRPRREVPA